MSPRGDTSFEDEGPVMNQWQPVQGQRRTEKSRRQKKPLPPSGPPPTKDQKNNNCKQQ